jgi:hypothetical protein
MLFCSLCVGFSRWVPSRRSVQLGALSEVRTISKKIGAGDAVHDGLDVRFFNLAALRSRCFHLG